MGEEEGRVAANSKPLFLQTGALKGPSGRVGSRIVYLIHHLENKVWESTCDPATCFFFFLNTTRTNYYRKSRGQRGHCILKVTPLFNALLCVACHACRSW